VIRDRLAPQSGGRGLFRRILRITGATESDVDARSQPVYSRVRQQDVPVSTTILAVLGQIELHLTAIASDRTAAERALDLAVKELAETLGSIVYSLDGRTLEAVVGDLLRHAGWRVAAAESCTGGLLTSRLTDVPGSSEYVEAGAICYSNRAKIDWLGVDAALIAEHGAVSEPVARAMAEHVRARAGVDVGLGVTGIAGPGGGTPGKPVGTVAVSVATGDATEARTFQFIGGREQVKYQATQAALNLLRLLMLRR
jgi:nicotinamide-nucleotide amidase